MICILLGNSSLAIFTNGSGQGAALPRVTALRPGRASFLHPAQAFTCGSKMSGWSPGPPQSHAFLGPQRHPWYRLGLALTNRRLHVQTLQQRRHDECHFHHRKGIANTNSRAAAEGEIGEGRQLLLTLGQEAVGVECMRFGKPARVVMADIGVYLNETVPGYGITADFDVGQRLPDKQAHTGRIETQRFLHDALRQRELRQIASDRCSARENRIELLLNVCRNAGIPGEAIQRPGQAGCRGIVVSWPAMSSVID